MEEQGKYTVGRKERLETVFSVDVEDEDFCLDWDVAGVSLELAVTFLAQQIARRFEVQLRTYLLKHDLSAGKIVNVSRCKEEVK